jgi:cytoskeleton protein RodZ
MTDDVTPATASAGTDDAGFAAGAAPAPATPAGEAPTTAGGMIRAARLAQGLDPAALAAMLKIPLRRLEALEQGRHDELQGATFERALAQAACRALKIDPKPVLAMLPQHEGNTLERVTEGINAPFRERQGGATTLADVSVVFRPVVLVPVLLVLGAIALLALPDGFFARYVHPVVAGASPGAAPAAPAASTVTANAAAAPGAQAASAPATLAAAGPDAAAAASAPAAARGASAALAAASAPAVPAADDAAVHPAVAPAIPVQVIATADSWVEVRDAQGRTLLSRTVLAGESVGLDGAMPMRVKVGNARGTRLTLRGDNVDLAPWTRDNVARLELK